MTDRLFDGFHQANSCTVNSCTVPRTRPGLGNRDLQNQIAVLRIGGPGSLISRIVCVRVVSGQRSSLEARRGHEVGEEDADMPSRGRRQSRKRGKIRLARTRWRLVCRALSRKRV
jgi:hypothetical protein